jgi:hypothetical protein
VAAQSTITSHRPMTSLQASLASRLVRLPSICHPFSGFGAFTVR